MSVKRTTLRSILLVLVILMLLNNVYADATGKNQVTKNNGKDPFRQDFQKQFQKSAAPRIPHEYCCCTTKKVDENTGSMLEVLNKIVQAPYFRYFKVDVMKPCSYWSVSLLCQSADNPCQVCKCSPDEVPFGLKKEPDMGCPAKPGGNLLGLDRTVKAGMAQDALWGGFQDEGGPDLPAGGEDHRPEYIDLVKNPEGNTGYVGEFANRIWEAIYDENCFQLGAGATSTSSTKPQFFEEFDISGDQKKLERSSPVCRQQQFLYQLISGLHASISTHIAIRYHPRSQECGENCGELRRRVLDHEDRVDNLYTLYLFLLRAMTRAGDSYLGDRHDYPANPSGGDDVVLRRQLEELFHKELLCSHEQSGSGTRNAGSSSTTFNESKILETPEGRLLVPQFQEKLANITTLMDCLTCEKCRVWGKLQTMGLAAALKVVMLPASTSVDLTRAEKVTMMNLLRQVTVSIRALTTSCSATLEYW